MVSLEASAWGQPLTVSSYGIVNVHIEQHGLVQYGVHPVWWVLVFAEDTH